MKLHLLRVDDWEALYVDGKCVYQNHSIDWPYVLRDILKGSGVELEVAWVQGWFDEDASYFPDELPEYVED